MTNLFSHAKGLVVSGALIALSVSGGSACTAPAPEAQGHTSAKLLAPKAMLKLHASTATQSSLGIAEWRIYRARHDFVLTGYDVKGRAVKGVSLGFLSHTATTKATLRARLLDGSHHAARHEFGGKSLENGTIPAASKLFVARVLADIAPVQKSYRKADIDHHSLPYTPYTPPAGTGTTTAPPAPPVTPATPLPAPDDTGCGDDMTSVVMDALECLLASGATSDPTTIEMCVEAAESAASSAGTCQDTGTMDPTQDPTGAGGDPTGAGGDPTGAGGDPTGAGGDPTGAGGDPTGAGADPTGTGGGDPTADGGYGDNAGGDATDAADDNGACFSCEDGGGDLGEDPGTGDVSMDDGYADGYADGVADYGDGF